MDRIEAQRLAMEIENEGWHAQWQQNTWTGEWYVRAWQGDTEEDEENCYALHFPVEWRRLQAALLDERMPFTQRDWSKGGGRGGETTAAVTSASAVGGLVTW